MLLALKKILSIGFGNDFVRKEGDLELNLFFILFYSNPIKRFKSNGFYIGSSIV